jgi:hypothetical protein
MQHEKQLRQVMEIKILALFVLLLNKLKFKLAILADSFRSLILKTPGIGNLVDDT